MKTPHKDGLEMAAMEVHIDEATFEINRLRGELAAERAIEAELVAALEEIEQTWRDWINAQNNSRPMPTTREAMHIIQERARTALIRAKQPTP